MLHSKIAVLVSGLLSAATILQGGAVHAASCAERGNIKSINSKQAINIRFVNRTNELRTVMWLNYEGQAIGYARLQPGQYYKQETFVGHPWMIGDARSQCIDIIVPNRSMRVKIRN